MQTRSGPASARCGSIRARDSTFLSWLALDREVLVVRQVDAGAKQALDERSDELEVHQQRDVDVSQPPRVGGWSGAHRAGLGGAARVCVADVYVHGLRRGRVREASVGRVVD